MADNFIWKMDFFLKSLREDAESHGEQVIGGVEGLWAMVAMMAATFTIDFDCKKSQF